MSCKCHCLCCPGGGVLAVLLLVLLACGFLSGIASLVGGVVESIALPSVAWAPVSAVAVGGTVWGLKVGARQHGRGEPLAVGLFGLVVAAAGLLLGLPVTLAGMAIVLAAALWSAMAARQS